MNTFPYESWEEAFQAAKEAGEGYFTWGPGGNTATIILTLLGFTVMLVTVVMGIMLEDRRLNEAAAELAKEQA
ncbi:MAG TPA: hypothetical protein ENH15_06100 [Actinobacteria bacterium]|nr:hypothetical protein [Actinomycetota bacterium]